MLGDERLQAALFQVLTGPENRRLRSHRHNQLSRGGVGWGGDGGETVHRPVREGGLREARRAGTCQKPQELRGEGARAWAGPGELSAGQRAGGQ